MEAGPPAPPGWYVDGDRRRYWDGERWTNAYRSPGDPDHAAALTDASSRRRRTFWNDPWFGLALIGTLFIPVVGPFVGLITGIVWLTQRQIAKGITLLVLAIIAVPLATRVL